MYIAMETINFAYSKWGYSGCAFIKLVLVAIRDLLTLFSSSN